MLLLLAATACCCCLLYLLLLVAATSCCYYLLLLLAATTVHTRTHIHTYTHTQQAVSQNNWNSTFWWSIWSSLWVTISWLLKRQYSVLYMYLGPKFHLWVYFLLHLVWRLVKHADSPEANNVAWHCTRTALLNPQIPALSHRVVGNWFGTFGGQLIQNSASELLKMELTLWQDISNMRWAQRLILWQLLLCQTVTNWKNNSSPYLLILENRCFTDGGIIISRISPLFSTASSWRFL